MNSNPSQRIENSQDRQESGTCHLILLPDPPDMLTNPATIVNRLLHEFYAMG